MVSEMVAGIIIAMQEFVVMNWAEALKVENGGPGDSPGREDAVRMALEDTRERYRKHGKKKAKGSATRKQLEVSRSEARSKGL